MRTDELRGKRKFNFSLHQSMLFLTIFFFTNNFSDEYLSPTQDKKHGYSYKYSIPAKITHTNNNKTTNKQTYNNHTHSPCIYNPHVYPFAFRHPLMLRREMDTPFLFETQNLPHFFVRESPLMAPKTTTGVPKPHTFSSSPSQCSLCEVCVTV